MAGGFYRSVLITSRSVEPPNNGGAVYLKFTEDAGKTTYVVYVAGGKNFDEEGVAVLQGTKRIATFKCINPDFPSEIGDEFFARGDLRPDPKKSLGFSVPSP